MITGFNPADMYGADHIRRVLQVFPGVFTSVGEFTIRKEFLSSKVAGDTASLTAPALDRILEFCAGVGLLLILHNDVDVPFARPDSEPVYLRQIKALLKRHPRASVIWALVEAMLADPELAHLYFDLSWDEVAKYAVASPEATRRLAAVINRHPDRFLFGIDEVAPADQARYLKVYPFTIPSGPS
jgi:hypothetical protein